MGTSLPLPGSLRPRHPDGDHPVLRALDPRNVADQEGLVAPGVQVPPLAAARIVARARLAAVRTSQRAPSGPLQLQPKLLRPPGRLHPGDLPLRTEAQNGIQPVPSSHVCEFLSVSFAGQAPRASAPRGSTTQSPPSPAMPKGSTQLLPDQQQYPWPGCPTKSLCVEWSRGPLVASAARPLPPRLTPSLAVTPPRLRRPPSPPHDSASDAPTHHDK